MQYRILASTVNAYLTPRCYVQTTPVAVHLPLLVEERYQKLDVLVAKQYLFLARTGFRLLQPTQFF